MSGLRALPGLALLAALASGCPAPTTSLDPIIDPVSRPEEPLFESSHFSPSTDCVACHPTHVEEWRSSSHAYAMVDPVFRALVHVRQQDFDGEQDTYCLQCHSAIGTRSHDIQPGFSFDDLPPVVAEGVTCEACHKAVDQVRDFNAGHVLDPESPQLAGIEDPDVDAALHPAAHSELLGSSRFCGGCHDVVELNGLNLERPYEEWLESPARADGRECHDCHMPERQGPAASGQPDRTIHDHRFVGVDVPLSDGFAPPEVVEDLRGRVVELLDGSAELRLSAAPVASGEQINAVITVVNRIDGHNLPTGSTFIRQLWLELTATDSAGQVLYRTGHLDENGDLRDHWSELDPYGDADLVTFGSRLTRQGIPEIFPWRADEHTSSAIPPLHDRTVTLFIPTADAAPGPVDIQARLRFRTHPPYLLRRLELDELIPRLGLYDIAEQQLQVAVE